MALLELTDHLYLHPLSIKPQLWYVIGLHVGVVENVADVEANAFAGGVELQAAVVAGGVQSKSVDQYDVEKDEWKGGWQHQYHWSNCHSIRRINSVGPSIYGSRCHSTGNRIY